jgi:UDP-GlcNAc3NAcA epimerase
MKVLTVIGARPQFIKAWPISQALAGTGIEEFVVHTGQHYDESMSGRFFSELGLREPAINVGVGSGSHGAQTGKMLEAIESSIVAKRPDWVLVYGDTNSTLAGALAAAKLHVRVGHVEAGLRSFNRQMPEEINRVLTDHVSTELFCPSRAAIDNLAREGITAGVRLVGDVMFDALRHFSVIAGKRSTVVRDLGLAHENYYLATVHRAENTADPERLYKLIALLAELDRPVVLPLHPRTRTTLQQSDGRAFGPSLRIVEPVGYLDMLELTRHARTVLTDSGGLQKEAYWLGVRCLTLRNETEWVETLESGWNELTGTDPQRILAALARGPTGDAKPHYGSGDAASRIVAALGEIS